MNRQRRSNIILGMLLILAGAWFLAEQFYPALRIWDTFTWTWPWILIGVGGLLLLIGLLVGAPGMAVPAAILAGVGGILYYQNQTGDWGSWIFLWTLIPGFVGVGILLADLLTGKLRQGLRNGGPLILISLILFSVFGASLGRLGTLVTYWPVLLILLGVWFVLQPLLKRGGKKA